jgi:hypothetical protein
VLVTVVQTTTAYEQQHGTYQSSSTGEVDV